MDQIASFITRDSNRQYYLRVPTTREHLIAYTGNVDQLPKVQVPAVMFSYPDEYGSSPLWYACLHEHEDMVARLVDPKIGAKFEFLKFEGSPHMPIIYALAFVGSSEGMRIALRNGANFNTNTQSGLHLWCQSAYEAIYANRLDVLRVLVENVTSGDIKTFADQSKKTPLSVAIRLKNEGAINLLLAKMVSLNTGVKHTDPNGTFIFQTHSEFAKYLGMNRLSVKIASAERLASGLGTATTPMAGGSDSSSVIDLGFSDYN